MHIQPTIHVDGLAGDETAGVRQQEQHGADEIIRYLRALEGAALLLPAEIVR